MLDGNTGEIVVEPDRDQRATVRERLAPQPLESPGATADGAAVESACAAVVEDVPALEAVSA